MGCWLADDIEKYYQSAGLEAKGRIPLYRLAWETAVSAFGTRQLLYERFFFGDPIRMASALFHNHDCTQYMDKVRVVKFSKIGFFWKILVDRPSCFLTLALVKQAFKHWLAEKELPHFGNKNTSNNC